MINRIYIILCCIIKFIKLNGKSIKCLADPNISLFLNWFNHKHLCMILYIFVYLIFSKKHVSVEASLKSFNEHLNK